MAGSRVPVHFSAPARTDFRDAVFWYEEQRPGLGDEFSQAVHIAANLIASGPERWPTRQGLHRYVLRRFNHRLSFCVRLGRDLGRRPSQP